MRRAAGMVAIGATLITACAAHAQTIQSNLWVTNGDVNAVAYMSHTVYIGGLFSRVGPPSGGFTLLDGSSGALLAPNPAVTGIVYSAIPDGSGGTYIGGAFDYVQGQPRNNLAHLDASGNVTAWHTGLLDGAVRALAIDASSPGVLYVAGFFSHVDGNPRTSTAAFDVATGALTGWDPGVFGANTLVARSGTIYIAGQFSIVQGQTRHNLAAVDASGALQAWDPNANSAVYAMVPFVNPVGHTLTLYIGGGFTSIGGQARYAIAAIDGATGAPTAWSPNGDHTVEAIALAYSPRGFITSVYAGGTFDEIGAHPRNHLAQLDVDTGVATAWDPSTDGTVSTILPAGGTVYVGGSFLHVGVTPRNFLAAIDATTGAATSWDPNPNRTISQLIFGPGGVYAGGNQTSLGGVARSNLAALDLTTGMATAWNPGCDGPVNVLQTKTDTLYVGGNFATVAGLTRHSAAALTGAGALTPWDPEVTGTVYAMARYDSTIFLGGQLFSVGGQTDFSFAAVDAATGAPGTPMPQPDDVVYALAHNGDAVYVGGAFTHVGIPSVTGIAAYSISGQNFVSAWGPILSPSEGPKARINTIVPVGDRVLLGGDFEILGGGPFHEGLVEILASTGHPTTWDATTNGVVNTIVAVGAPVFLSGNFDLFRVSSNTYLNQLVAIVPDASAAINWAPQVDPNVYASCWAEDRLVVGGSFFAAGGMPHGNLAAIQGAVAAVHAVPPTPGRLRLSENPAHGAVWVGFPMAAAGPAVLSIVDPMGRLLRRIAVARLEAGEQRLAWDGADAAGRKVPAGQYLVRVHAGGTELAAKLLWMR